MKKIDFRELANHQVQNLIPYQPGKPLEELEREMGITEAIKLASNENPLGPSPSIMSAVQASLQNAHFYPDGTCYELKQALASFLKIQPGQITVGNGSENIFELIIKAYLHKDSKAIISQYAFLTISLLLQCYNIPTEVVPANPWGHDVSQIIKAVDEKTRVIFLVNPNNPTGTYINQTDFKLLLENIPTRVLIVVDEAYYEYVTSADYPKALNYLRDYPNLIITRTFSKVYALAALRVGYAVSSIEIADILNRVRLPFNVNTVAAKAACAALLDQNHVQKSVALNQQGQQQIIEYLQKLNVSYIPSITNFVTIDVGHAAHFYQHMLSRGIIVRPLQAYSMPKHVRITIGTSAQNEQFLSTLHDFFKQ